jgi:hypothetical protein
VAAACLDHEALVEMRVIFALVGDERLGGELHRLLDHGGREIGDADMARHAATLCERQALQAVAKRDLVVGPVDQQQVDLVEAKALEAGFGGTLQVALADIGEPDLGRHENLVTRHAAMADAFAHRRLVLIHGGGVDVAITDRQRVGDGRGTVLALHRPGAEAELRDAGTVGFDDGRHRRAGGQGGGGHAVSSLVVSGFSRKVRGRSACA